MKYDKKKMNQEIKRCFSELYNIRFCQDFVNINMKWLCFCKNSSEINY